MYSGEYDACDVTLSVYPHWASLKNIYAWPRWESNLRPLEYSEPNALPTELRGQVGSSFEFLDKFCRSCAQNVVKPIYLTSRPPFVCQNHRGIFSVLV